MSSPWVARSLQFRATLIIAVLLCLLALRSLCVGVVHWMGAHDPEALSDLAALGVELHQLDLGAGAAADVDPRAIRDRAQLLLHGPALRAAVFRPFRHALRSRYDTLQQQWAVVLEPALVEGGKLPRKVNAERLATTAGQLQQELQREHARLNAFDLAVQLVLLLVSGSLLLLLLFGLRRQAVEPLNKLLAATEQFRAGKLDVRVRYDAPDEMGRLAQGFNAMARDIEEAHRELQARVEIEARNLLRANAALSLFCSGSHSIAHAETGAADIDELLRSFQDLLPGLQLTLCLHPAPEHLGGQVISFQGEGGRQVCSYQDCDSCGHFSDEYQEVFAVCSQGQVLGELRVLFVVDNRPGDWERMLAQALANLIGNAIQLGRQRERDNLLLLNNERNTIARELHDSLAQSLSFLRIQVVRLQMLTAQGGDSGTVHEVSETLGQGLDEAYRQLRELLTTFRISLSDVNLQHAMKSAVEEFSRRGDYHLFFQAEELAVPLAAVEEIHLLQILRESLSNCSRHSGARQVWVSLRQVDEEVELLVEDDGRGLEPDDSREAFQSHGVSILQERARSIGGRLTLAPRAPAGTRVSLRFRPRFLAGDAAGETT